MSVLANAVLEKVRSFSTHAEAADFFQVEVEDIEAWLQGGAITVQAAERVFRPEIFAPRVEETKKITFMFPWYKTTNPVTAFSIQTLLDRRRMSMMLDFGDAFVAHSRNTLAARFLATKSEWALTVDDDMILPCGRSDWFNDFTKFDLPAEFAGLNTVDRLLSHGHTLVGALYFGRWEHGKPMYAEGMKDKTEEAWIRRGPYDVCKPTRWVGTGCMLIHRSVFEDIEKTFPSLARNSKGRGHWFTSSEHDICSASDEALQVLGDTNVSETVRLAKAEAILNQAKSRAQLNSRLGTGEDVQFCIRAAQAGHQPHVDCGLLCGHLGHFVFGPRPPQFV